MTLTQYERTFMFDLEDEWNCGARKLFVHWDAFVYQRWMDSFADAS
jgi:hypothetical protein